MDGKHRKRRNKIYYTARGFGLSHEDAEDMSQEFSLRQLEQKDLKQNSKQFVISTLRRMGHDPRTKSHVPINSHVEIPDNVSVLSNPETMLRIEKELSNFEKEDRAIIVLRNLWGLSVQEIAFVLGYSDTMLSQIISERGLI